MKLSYCSKHLVILSVIAGWGGQKNCFPKMQESNILCNVYPKNEEFLMAEIDPVWLAQPPSVTPGLLVRFSVLPQVGASLAVRLRPLIKGAIKKSFRQVS